MLKNDFLTHERDVVYMFVELRKLFEHNKIKVSNFPYIKLFSDWIVHTRKDRIPKQLKPLVVDLITYFKNQHQSELLKDFFSLQSLFNELIEVLEVLRIPSTQLTQKSDAFKSKLIGVIKDQPFVFVIQTGEFEIKSASQGMVIVKRSNDESGSWGDGFYTGPIKSL